MTERAEVNLVIRALKRMRLQVSVIAPGSALNDLDFGLRSMLGMEVDYEHVIQNVGRWIQPRKIYKMVDPFLCHYIFFFLPGEETATLVIGPYLTADPSREQILEQSERMGISLQMLPRQSEYYAALPVFSDPSAILALVSALGESLWGSAAAFEIADVNYEQRIGLPVGAAPGVFIEETSILTQMRQMEERYAYENTLMEIVSKGKTQEAEIAMASVSQLNFAQRLGDPLRNLKNYCIICNTLLRKAAEQGGVHPLHLDQTSGQFARTIENSPSLDAAYALIGEMLRTYTRLVRNHANRRYSALVQKTVTYIEANLSGDLSLHTLAEIHQVTPVYLSALFHKETGKTLVEWVNEQRMKAAAQLLKTTYLQIQNIAQLCGFSDPNYFSKLFKRFHGLTPGQFRKDPV